MSDYPLIYEANYRVRVIDTDMFGLCRASSIMDFMQEAATEHANCLDIGAVTLAQQHAIWMLVRMHYTLLRPIRGGERLHIRTWGRQPRAAFVTRDFEIYADEALVGRAVSVWVLGDLENHTLLRAEEILPSGRWNVPENPAKSPGKIRMPAEMTDAGERRIGYSETDENGHANNTRYADYACDALHFERRRGQYVKKFQITYSAECLAGQTIYMRCAESAQTAYVRGVDKDGKSHFDIRMELAEI